MRMAIETAGLSRRFGSLQAVDRLDLRVESGAVYGFLGANGAGKTTAIRMLLGLIRPDAGSVRLLAARFARSTLGRVGALVEAPALYGHLTGRENLEVVRRLTGRNRVDIDRAIETVRLSDAAGRPVDGYSLGMRQRLGLAVALLGDPELLILDEPTNGLDPAGIREIRDLLPALSAGRGITVFVSSHLLSEVEQIASHVGIIDRGRLLFQGPLATLRRRAQPYLELRSDRIADAANLLGQASFRVLRRNGDGLVVQACDAAAAARANALLVAAGVAVHHLRLCSPDLEDIFLELTRNPEERDG
jgi:ABC-type multidrug transport system ATPase subunit